MKKIYESMYSGALRQYEGDCSEYMVPMRDGVKLYTVVCRRSETQKGPVVVLRNCYCNQNPLPEVIGSDWSDWVEAGYIFICQHCRGTGKSDGEFMMYQQERNDGLDLLDWVRQQSFYDHEIFLSGGSYLSSVCYAWLNAAGDDVKGAILPVQDCNRYNVLYRNGFYKSLLHGSWLLDMYKRKKPLPRTMSVDTFRTMPLTQFSENAFGENSPVIQEEFAHPCADDPFWETEAGGAPFTHALDNLKMPVLFASGFYDIYLEGMLKMWEDLPEEARAKCAFVISPFAHDFTAGNPPVIDFEKASLDKIWPYYRIEWCNAVREKRAPQFVSLGQITYYAQYEKKWVTVPHLENGGKPLQFFLGDHVLCEKPGEDLSFRYLYDPYNPASFKGGCCNTFGGQQLQDAPNSRYDILSFVSEALNRNVRLLGTGKVTLQVASDCEDTCFYARLSHVRADGNCYCLRDDIVSLRSQFPHYRPGEKAAITLNFAANALLLQAGDRLRLDVSSSCFPNFVPHRNTLENYWEAATAKSAHNTLYASGSKLELFEAEEK